MKVVLVFFAFVCILACSQNAENKLDESRDQINMESMEKNESSNDWINFRKSGISMDFPVKWTLEESNKPKLLLIAFPEGAKGKSRFSDNLNIVIQNDSSGKLTLGNWAKMLDQGNSKHENYKLLKSNNKKLGDLDVHEIIYDATRQDIDLRYFQYLIIKDKKAYNLTFTAKQSTYDSNLSDVKRIFDSFKLV